MNLFTDKLNRKIEILSPPKRIISLVPSQTELLYDLGLRDEVVGITKFCIHPDEWFKSKMHVEYQSKGMNISRRRAELYNIEQMVTDKKDENGNATGTTITVKIPVDFK